jgi:hypothetical protein
MDNIQRQFTTEHGKKHTIQGWFFDSMVLRPCLLLLWHDLICKVCLSKILLALRFMNELQKSLDTITMENDKNIILAGDFNCPDIDWTNMTTTIHANDKEIQKSLIEMTAQAGLTQIHEEPTRE